MEQRSKRMKKIVQYFMVVNRLYTCIQCIFTSSNTIDVHIKNQINWYLRSKSLLSSSNISVLSFVYIFCGCLRHFAVNQFQIRLAIARCSKVIMKSISINSLQLFCLMSPKNRAFLNELESTFLLLSDKVKNKKHLLLYYSKKACVDFAMAGSVTWMEFSVRKVFIVGQICLIYLVVYLEIHILLNCIDFFSAELIGSLKEWRPSWILS